MSETIKLIIEIPQEIYSDVLTDGVLYIDYVAVIGESIKNGIPLDNVKTEIKAMFPPLGNWMYGEECEHEHTVCEVLADVLKIIDNVGKGDEE